MYKNNDLFADELTMYIDLFIHKITVTLNECITSVYTPVVFLLLGLN